jgi:hypothetical protein
MRPPSFPRVVRALLATAFAVAATAAHAQAALDAPPPLPADTPESTRPSGVPPAAQPVDAGAEAPTAPAKAAAAQTLIEQRRRGNRVVEVTVTPAGSTHSYVIVNREGQRPQSLQDLSAGLSTPRFFRFDF